jgi:hypothetical protein
VIRIAQRRHHSNGAQTSARRVGPRWLNGALEGPLRLEARWLAGGRTLAAGLSLMAVLRNASG